MQAAVTTAPLRGARASKIRFEQNPEQPRDDLRLASLLVVKANASGGLVVKVATRPCPSRRRCPTIPLHLARRLLVPSVPFPLRVVPLARPARRPVPASRLLKPAASSVVSLTIALVEFARVEPFVLSVAKDVRFPVEGLAPRRPKRSRSGSTPFEQPCGGGGLRGDPSAYVAVSAFAPVCALCASGWMSSWSHQFPRAWARDPSGQCRGPCTGDETGTAEGAPPRRARSPRPARSPIRAPSRTMTSTVVTRAGRIAGSRLADACSLLSQSSYSCSSRSSSSHVSHVGPGSYCVVPGRETAEASKAVLQCVGAIASGQWSTHFMTRRRRPERNAKF